MSYEQRMIDILAVFGLNPKRHFPDEGRQSRFVMIKGDRVCVWILPAYPRSRWKSSRHRVMCLCPLCGHTLSVARLPQHKDTAACARRYYRSKLGERIRPSHGHKATDPATPIIPDKRKGE